MSYSEAKVPNAAWGVDTDAAIAKLKAAPVSLAGGRRPGL